MSGNYRVEIASTGRAGCQSTDCKKAGTKIEKGALRLGVWVEIEGHGSWRWRHWGCVTGKMLENIRNGIQDPGNPAQYRWDYLDGYEGEDKHGLQDSPDLQEKVRRVITQGFIDADDWNGDPEMNKLGEKGTRTKESIKKAKDEEKANGLREELNALQAQLDDSAGASNSSDLETRIKDIEDMLENLVNPTPKKKAAPRKRKAEADEDDEGEKEEIKPAAKKRATKAKKEADLDDEDTKPAAKKSRAKKAVKKEEEEDGDAEEAEPTPPVKKSRAKKVKKEEDMDMDMDDDEEDVKPAPAKKSRAKAVKKEENDDVPAPKKRAPRAKKVKEEPTEDGDEVATSKPAPKKRGKTVKKDIVAAASNPGMTDGSSLDDAEETQAANSVNISSDLPDLIDSQDSKVVDAVSQPDIVDEDLPEGEVEVPKLKPKKGAKTKTGAAKAAKSTRGTRSRTTSGI